MTAQGHLPKLDAADPAKVDRCTNYLSNKAPYLNYGISLRGWLIFTGQSRGLPSHHQGPYGHHRRSPLAGAEVVLRLRTLGANDDINDYWRFNLSREQEQIHLARYTHNALPKLA